MSANKFRNCEIREDVKLNLPDGWKLRVVEVTSGDSGKKYFVQYLSNKETKQRIVTCQCPQGYFQIPLTVLGFQESWCKHARDVAFGLGGQE